MFIRYIYIDEITDMRYASNYCIITFDVDRLHRENYNWKPEVLIRNLEQDCVGIIPTEISLRTCTQASICTYKYYVSCIHFASASNMLLTCSYVAVNMADHIVCQRGCKEEIQFSYCQLSRYVNQNTTELHVCVVFVVCGCFSNMCTCIYCILYCLYCIFCIVSFMYIYSYLFCQY
jgi:hypothetical protein